MPAKNSKDSEQTTETPAQDPNNAPPEQPQPVEQNRPVAELANDVLSGHFGDFNVARENLDKAGADSSAVMTVVNDRLSHGAPSVYRPNAAQVLDSARRGEWGNKNVGLRVRAAGFSELDASHVETEYTRSQES